MWCFSARSIIARSLDTSMGCSSRGVSGCEQNSLSTNSSNSLFPSIRISIKSLTVIFPFVRSYSSMYWERLSCVHQHSLERAVNVFVYGITSSLHLFTFSSLSASHSRVEGIITLGSFFEILSGRII